MSAVINKTRNRNIVRWILATTIESDRARISNILANTSLRLGITRAGDISVLGLADHLILDNDVRRGIVNQELWLSTLRFNFVDASITLLESIKLNTGRVSCSLKSEAV